MPQPLICIWYDTEDWIDPASDDAALHIARAHSASGVAATFKLVGNKVRVLLERGRHDVIAALAEHDIGYHTDYHSVHPVVTEYCEPLPWASGVALFRRLETAGYDLLRRTFGRLPSTYGQPGSSWAPQAYPTLRDWGIGTYIDVGPWVALDGQPFWYMGVLHAMGLTPDLRFDPRRPETVPDALNTLRDEVQRQTETGGVISIYYHPCEWSSDRFWDGINFAHGCNPPHVWQDDCSREAWQVVMPPAPSPGARRERELALESWLVGVASSGARSITCRQFAQHFPDATVGQPLTREELVESCSAWDGGVNYIRTKHGWLTAGETLTAAAQLCVSLARRGSDAECSAVPHAVDGPALDPPDRDEQRTIASRAVPEACEWLLDLLNSQVGTPCLPRAVPVEGHAVSVPTFLRAVIDWLREPLADERAALTLEPCELLAESHVASGPGHFRWACFAPDFEAPNVLAAARRQAWTLKPALRNAE